MIERIRKRFIHVTILSVLVALLLIMGTFNFVAFRSVQTNADLMLDSSFTDADALKTYANHPEHVAVANSAVCPFTKTRCCLDFES